MNDYLPSYFICLNYTVYSNYKNDFFSTIYYFSKDKSSRKIDYEKKLIFLFDKLELDQGKISELFSVGHKHLSNEAGVLFQIFDMSSINNPVHPYQYTNPLIGTFSHNDMDFSEAVEGLEPTHFYLQTRLLMSNHSTLNPYSPLVILRYEMTDPQIIVTYEKEMREIIKNLQPDLYKSALYKAELASIWSEAIGH